MLHCGSSLVNRLDMSEELSPFSSGQVRGEDLLVFSTWRGGEEVVLKEEPAQGGGCWCQMVCPEQGVAQPWVGTIRMMPEHGLLPWNQSLDWKGP